MSEPLLSIKNLKVAFKRESKWDEAVHGINLEVFASRVLASR